MARGRAAAARAKNAAAAREKRLLSSSEQVAEISESLSNLILPPYSSALPSVSGSPTQPVLSEPTLPPNHNQPLDSPSSAEIDSAQVPAERTWSDNQCTDHTDLLCADSRELPLEDVTSDAGDSEEDGCGDERSVEGDVLESEDSEKEDDCALRLVNKPIPIDEANKIIADLDRIVADAVTGHGKDKSSKFDDLTLSRIRLMTMTLRLRCVLNCGLIKASWLAAVAVGRSTWAARRARRWIRHFQTTGELPMNLHGKWNDSVIEDEDFAAAVRDHLRRAGKYARAQDVIDFFFTSEAKEFSYLLDAPPSIRTAQRWMKNMGYRWGTERRGQFADGHERSDVVEYRMKYYIPGWLDAERRMRSWTDNGKEIPPVLREGERGVVYWFHDESTFYAHDRRLTRWIHKGETASLYKKGEGVSLMVADFVSADYEWLQRVRTLVGTGEEDYNHARVVFGAGKQHDGWFCTKDVVAQLTRAMVVVKEEYPDEDHVFVFDNATTHTKLPDDAPVVNKMTLGHSHNVGGEIVGESGEKEKINMAPVVLSNGLIQELYYPANHHKVDLRGAFKGLTKLLEERGVPGARKLKLQCPKTGGRTGCPPGRTDCCARQTMLNQPEFRQQKSILQGLAELHGYAVVYLPKYHCELNPIEQCWGAAKRVYRECPISSSEADLKRNKLNALETVKSESIRRFAARSRRFVRAYHDGLTGMQAAWAQKHYKGHRVITDSIMEATGVAE